MNAQFLRSFASAAKKSTPGVVLHRGPVRFTSRSPLGPFQHFRQYIVPSSSGPATQADIQRLENMIKEQATRTQAVKAFQAGEGKRTDRKLMSLVNGGCIGVIIGVGINVVFWTCRSYLEDKKEEKKREEKNEQTKGIGF